MATNPVSFQMVQPSGGIITCVSNAAFWQKVTLTWTILHNTTTIVFQGTGEGVAMKLADGSTSYPVPTARQNYNISAQFQFSASGSQGPFSNASVKDPIIINNNQDIQILVTSEDSTDNDYNDSYLMINYQSLG